MDSPSLLESNEPNPTQENSETEEQRNHQINGKRNREDSIMWWHKMTWLYVIAIAALIGGSFPCRNTQIGPVWTYTCDGGRCLKQPARDGGTIQSLSVCKVMCDPYALLWPRPNGALGLGRTLVPVNANHVTVQDVGLEVNARAGDLLEQAAIRFRSQLVRMARQAEVPPMSLALPLHVDVIIRDKSVISVVIDVDESYELALRSTESMILATVKAATFFGVRHALETLSQLCVVDDVTNSLLMFSEANVTDRPIFHYRGVNLDTARNYITVDSIKRTLEGMAINKLNTFHWHITDSHSWPFVSDSFPQLSRYGAYSKKQVYTPADIRGIVEYGRVRGVRVLPELDAPAHVGEGFQWTDPGTIVCFKAEPWPSYCVEPPCGQLNPSKEQVYTILSGVYADMLRVFDSDIFHMGGDEVHINCWNSSISVLEGMSSFGFNYSTTEGFYQLWDFFQRRALNSLINANGGKKLPVILWTSGLTENGNVERYLDKETYIIEIWTKGDDPHIAELVNKGYRVIFSNHDALYLDCGFAGWVTGGNNWCSPYIGWQKVYNNSPYKLLANLNVSSSEAKRLTMGAEASLWTEQSDDASLDNRLWPRVAAMAERLWSDPQEGWKAAENRMLYHRQRLHDNGFYPGKLQPRWCHQNEGHCPLD